MADDVQVKFGADTSDLEAGGDRVKKEITDIGTAVKGIGASAVAAGAGLAAAFAVSALSKFAIQMANTAEQVDNMAQRTGMTVEEVQRLNVVAEATGVSVNALTSAQQRLATNFSKANAGSAQQTKMFAQLGIDIKNVTGQQDLLNKVADAFAQYKDGPEKNALAMQLMGRAGTQLIPILNQGSKAMQDAADNAEKYGAIMSGETVAAAKELDDALDEQKIAFQGVGNTLAASFIPIITQVVEWVNGMAEAIVQNYNEGGVWKVTIDALVVTLKSILTVIEVCAGILTGVFVVAVEAATAALGILMGTGAAIVKVFQGDLPGASREFAKWTKAGFDGAAAQGKKYETDEKARAERLKKLWSGGPAAAKPGEEKKDAPNVVTGGGNGAAEARRKQREALEEELSGIQARQDAARDDMQEQIRLQDEKLAAIKRIMGEDSREYRTALREKARMERDYAQEVLQIQRETVQLKSQIAQTELQADDDINTQKLERQRENLELQRDLGKISNSQYLSEKAQFLAQEQQQELTHQNNLYQLQLKALQDQLALENLRPQERRKIDAQIEQLAAEHNARMKVLADRQATEVVKSQADASRSMAAQWQRSLQPIGQAFNGMFQNLYNGTMTFKQAFLGALDQIVLSFISMATEMAVKWAATEIAKTTATTAGVATRTAAEATGAATGSAISIGAAIKDITISAYRAAAGAYAALASIPYVGPILAPAAAAAALAAVIGFGSSIASAEGGWGKVPKDGTITELHKDEMVLPSGLANPLRSAISGFGLKNTGGGLGAGAAQNVSNQNMGGDVNMQYSPTVNGGNKSLNEMLRRDGGDMRRWVKNEFRNGGFRRS